MDFSALIAQLLNKDPTLMGKAAFGNVGGTTGQVLQQIGPEGLHGGLANILGALKIGAI